MTIEVGQQLLHYRLIKKIGEGGMGVVYEATDTRLDRNVAVKVLPPELTRDPERSARFHQEARLAAAFNHPNIATVHDVGEQDGVTFIVMELVRGESLRSLVRDEPLERRDGGGHRYRNRGRPGESPPRGSAAPRPETGQRRADGRGCSEDPRLRPEQADR